MRVALFVTCFNDALYPQTGKAVVRLLERLGHEVVFPLGQTCCGQMHINTGYYREAVPLAHRWLEVFDGYDAVVSPSPSCVGTVRESYPRIAHRIRDSALDGASRAAAPRLYELSEFLVDVLGVEDVGAYFPHRVTYHPTCHSLRGLHVGDRPYRLLRAVKGLTLVDLPNEEECCGFGGTFAMKNADVSVAIGADKARHTRDTGAEVLCALDNSCLTHVGGILSRQQAGVRALHLAEILASSEQTASAAQQAPRARAKGSS
jgi:L-lactate dehydrogenase complex protein LldE